jgi:rhodanese-related sulfurtransferase
MADMLRIGIDELKKRIRTGEKFTFVDVRNPQAWAESSVMLPGALRVPMDNFEANLSKIPRDKPIVTYCT